MRLNRADRIAHFHIARQNDAIDGRLDRGVAVLFFQLLQVRPVLRVITIKQSAIAPDNSRMKVKLAASIVVSLSASRQSSELLANATIASSVRMTMRIQSTLTT